MIYSRIQSRPIAIAAIVSLSISGIFGIGAPSYATPADTPTIVFDGNTISSSVPVTETATREPAGALTLSTASLSRTAATTRTGYTFGGWSLTAGGPVTNTITTATSADITRTIFAVWNTTLNYNTNGADSGSPAGALSSQTYRFGQTLTLPTVGTMVKAGFAFGGWMSESVSTARQTTYTAATAAVGNPTVYAAWIKTVTFNANTATTGTIPGSLVFVAGSPAIKLPVFSETTLRKPGFDFMGWSTSATGNPVTNPGSYTPLTAQQTLYAVWRIQTSQATSRVFFKPGKAVLRASQKLEIRDLGDSLKGRNAVKVTLVSRRHSSTKKSLGRDRNAAIVRYLASLGVQATFTKSNAVGPGGTALATKNNRVTIQASWTN